MASYNWLTTAMECSHCQAQVEVVIDCYFGYTSEMRDYQIGDEYHWRPRQAVHNGGRPEGGHIAGKGYDGKGYTECPGAVRSSSSQS